jgi:N-acetylmuramoyl-L-alanine amidase
MEVYVHNFDNSNSKASIALGVSILHENTQKLGFEKRGVKFANFQVLQETISYYPSVLVEIGFITNPDEADYFLEAKNIKALALAVLMGVLDYLNTLF